MKLADWRWLPVVALSVALPAMAQAPMASNRPIQRELIYCADLMTHAERETYRANMQAAVTPQAQEALRTDHQRNMQARARTAGREDPCDVPLRQRAGQGAQGGVEK